MFLHCEYNFLYYIIFREILPTNALYMNKHFIKINSYQEWHFINSEKYI